MSFVFLNLISSYSVYFSISKWSSGRTCLGNPLGHVAEAAQTCFFDPTNPKKSASLAWMGSPIWQTCQAHRRTEPDIVDVSAVSWRVPGRWRPPALQIVPSSDMSAFGRRKWTLSKAFCGIAMSAWEASEFWKGHVLLWYESGAKCCMLFLFIIPLKT